jgi:hypothetical protein
VDRIGDPGRPPGSRRAALLRRLLDAHFATPAGARQDPEARAAAWDGDRAYRIHHPGLRGDALHAGEEDLRALVAEGAILFEETGRLGDTRTARIVLRERTLRPCPWPGRDAASAMPPGSPSPRSN